VKPISQWLSIVSRDGTLDFIGASLPVTQSSGLSTCSEFRGFDMILGKIEHFETGSVDLKI